MWVNYYFMIVSAVIFVVSIILGVLFSGVVTKTEKGLIDADSKMARISNNEDYQNFVCALFIISLIVLAVTGIFALVVEVGRQSDILLWMSCPDYLIVCML